MLRRPTLLVAALLLLVLPVVVASADGVTEVSDTLSVIKEGDVPSNAEVAVDLSQATPLAPTRVLIGRDDVFVDSMTSGVLQSASPLLLVPPEGPVPDFVMDELSRLDAARVTLLGGEAAVQPAVADQLADAGYAVDRKAGNSRFETAIEIAEDAPPATTAILTRAFAHPDATDETQAFADSLAAGGMAAENGWPILLTQTDVLSGPTADYMAAKNYDRVLIMGGTAAISQAVEDAVRDLGVPTIERISGPNRFGTGIEVAKELGADSADDVDRVTLVDGQASDAWAGGFAAAAHSAFFDAPIVLGTGDTLPAETAAWLAGEGATGAFAGIDQSQIRLTCVIDADVCESGRVELGLPPTVPVAFAPPTGATVAPGATIAVNTNGSPATVAGGTCVPGAPFPLPQDLQVTITDQPEGPTCTLVVTIDLGNGLVQTESVTYIFGEPSVVTTLLSVDGDGNAVGGSHPDIAEDAFGIVYESAGNPTGEALDANIHLYVLDSGGHRLLDVRPDGTPGSGKSLSTDEDRPRISATGQFVVFTTGDPALDADGLIWVNGDNVYLRDIANGVTRLLSVDANGEAVSRPSYADVSDDGTVAVYMGDGASSTGTRSMQVFIRDLTLPATSGVRVLAKADGGAFTNADAFGLDLSGDGEWLALGTGRADFFPDDNNARADFFLVRLADGSVQRLSVNDNGEPAEGDTATVDDMVATTADGVQTVFTSGATNLAGTGGTSNDVFVRHVHDGTTTLISRADDAGTQLDGAGRADISDSGLFVTFLSDLVPSGAEAGTGCGVYRVTAGGATLRMDVGELGETNDAACSASGQRASVNSGGLVAYSVYGGLVPEDTNGALDVYFAVGLGG